MRDLRHLAAWVRRLVREEVRELVGPTRRVCVDQGGLDSGALPSVRLCGHTGEDLDAFVAQPFGLASRVPDGTELVIVRSGRQWVVVGARDSSHRPTLNDGDSALYSTAAALVVGADGNLVFDNGTKEVARKGDSCSHTLSAPAGGGTVTGTITINGGTSRVKVP